MVHMEEGVVRLQKLNVEINILVCFDILQRLYSKFNISPIFHKLVPIPAVFFVRHYLFACYVRKKKAKKNRYLISIYLSFK